MNLTYDKATIIGMESHFPLFHENTCKTLGHNQHCFVTFNKVFNSTGKGRVHYVNRTTCIFGIL